MATNLRVISATGTYDVVTGQWIIAQPPSDVVTLNFPSAELSIGRSIRVTAQLAPGAVPLTSIVLQPTAGEFLSITNTGVESPAPGSALIALGTDTTYCVMDTIFTAASPGPGIFVWYGQDSSPTQLRSTPNSGDPTDTPSSILIVAHEGRGSAVAGDLGREAVAVQVLGGKGGAYTGASGAEFGGSGTSILNAGGAGGDANGTDGSGGAGGSLLNQAGNGGDVQAGPGNGGVGGLPQLVGGRGGDVVGPGNGNGGISLPGEIRTGHGGSILGGGVGNGGASGAVAFASGTGGAAGGAGDGGASGAVALKSGDGGTSVGGTGGASGQVEVDVGNAFDGGVVGELLVGFGNAIDVFVGNDLNRVHIPRISEFEDVTTFNTATVALVQYNINVLTGVNALITCTLPTLTGEPSQVGMACRVIFGVAGTGVGTITVVADTGAGDTALTPAITAIVPQLGTSFVFRTYGTSWFLESRVY